MEAADDTARNRSRALRIAIWVAFGGTWIATGVLMAISRFADDFILTLLLWPFLPLPVFCGFLFAPYAIDAIDRLGRHLPWLVGFGSYIFVGAVVMIVQWAVTGYGGVFSLYMWPIGLVGFLACPLHVWWC